jgi:hypothetical protein
VNSYHILACKTIAPELLFVMKKRGCDYPVSWIPPGNHLWPQKLHSYIQHELDNIGAGTEAVLLALGFCGNALVGIKAGKHRLVLPRAADCVTLFLGSGAKRREQGSGVFFFTEGNIRTETSFINDLAKWTEKWGEKRAANILKTMLENYKQTAVIDTGVSDIIKLKEELQPVTNLINAPVSVIQGDLRLFDALLAGNWNSDDFIVIEPGGAFTLEHALSEQDFHR